MPLPSGVLQSHAGTGQWREGFLDEQQNDALSSAGNCRRIAGFSNRYGVKSSVYMSKDAHHLDRN